MISSFPPDRCGIAVYTEKLVQDLGRLTNVTVIGNYPDYQVNELNRDFKVIRSWRKNSSFYFIKIWIDVLREHPDVIHVQHEYLLYGVRKYAVLFLFLLLFLKLTHKPLIVTMHSVVSIKSYTGSFFELHSVGGKFSVLKKGFTILFTKSIAWLSDCIIVHNEAMKKILLSEYSFERSKITVIPHGVEKPSKIRKVAEMEDELDIVNNQIVLFYGFIIPGKGIEELIEATSLVLNEIPEMKLVIAGGYHPRLSIENPSYLGTIEELIDKNQLGNNILFINEFISTEKLRFLISATDIIVFPYTEDRIIGASGALASCVLFGKPVIASNIHRFSQDIKEDIDGLLVEPGDIKQLGESIILLLRNEDMRSRLGKNLVKNNMYRTWKNVAKMTHELYSGIGNLHK